ncbi:MAG: hypothetical protein N2B06_02305 [Clostridium sp.]
MNRKAFKILIIVLAVVSCVVIGFSVFSHRSSSFIFTKTTNLSEEHIGGLQLYDNIDSKEFIKKYGIKIQRLENDLFDYYKLSNDLEIAVNNNRQIIRIAIDDISGSSINTSKNIGVGNSVDEIIKVYGNNYYKRMSDFGVPVIGYVDKEREINLEFFNYENTVVIIRYDINSMQ